MSIGKYFYKMWLAVLIIALSIALLISSFMLNSFNQARKLSLSDVTNKDKIEVVKTVNSEVNQGGVLYSELVGNLSLDNYTIVVRSTRDHIDSNDNYVIKPYDLVYTYTNNGTNEYWTQISYKNDKYGVNKYLSKISVAKRANGVYTYSNFIKKSEYSSKNPYKLGTFVEKDYIGEISNKEMKYISDILFQVIVDTSPLIYKISDFNENYKIINKSDNYEMYQYSKNDTISNIEVYKANDFWVYRVVPTYNSVSDLIYQYQIKFEI